MVTARTRALLLASCVVSAACFASDGLGLPRVVSNGDTHVTVDEFGRMDSFAAAPHVDSVYGFEHFVAVDGGVPMPVDEANFTVDRPILEQVPADWLSQVSRPDLTLEIAGRLVNEFDGDGLGEVVMEFAFENATEAPMVVDHFLFMDLDVLGYLNDLATFNTMGNTSWVEQEDADAGNLYKFAVSGQLRHWLVDSSDVTYPTMSSAGASFELPDGSSPFGPGDVSIVFQMRLEIEPHQRVAHALSLESLESACDMPPEIRSRFGNVSSRLGRPPVDVLSVNGQTGDQCSRLLSRPAGPAKIQIGRPNDLGFGRPQFRNYAIWVFQGEPTAASVDEIRVRSRYGEESLGLAGFRLPLSSTAGPSAGPAPLAFPSGFTSFYLTNADRAAAMNLPLNSHLDPAPISIPIVFPAGRYTVQGVIVDFESPNSPLPVSVTNAVVVEARP